MVSFEDVLKSHTLDELRKMVKNMNVSNYIKLRSKDDKKLSKNGLMKLIISHYTMGKDKSGNKLIVRANIIKDNEGSGGAKIDKAKLLEGYLEQVVSGDMTQKEAMKAFRANLKDLISQGVIFKATRKNPQAKTPIVKEKKKTINFNIVKKIPKKKKEELESGEKTLSQIVAIIEEISNVGKKAGLKIAKDNEYDSAIQVREDFNKNFDKHNEWLEGNGDKKGAKEFSEEYTKLLKRFSNATTKSKAKKAKFGLTEQAGEGLKQIINGAIKGIKMMF